MSFEIFVTPDVRHIRVTVRGRATPGQLASLFELLQVDSAEWLEPEVLIDLAALEGAFTASEQARVAAQARQRLHPKRVTLRWSGAKP